MRTLRGESRGDGVATDEFEFAPTPMTLDANGYAPSFMATQRQELRAFFDKFNFVVVRDVLTGAEIRSTAEEIFAAAGWKDGSPPATLAELERVNWEDVYCSRYNMSKGFLGYEAANTAQAWANRLASPLRTAYAALFDRNDLLVKIDRFGMMRPTVFEEAEVAAPRREWQTTGEWIHWDQNPWLEPEFERVQGVLAISDHTAASGGFHCVPGFAKYWKAWAAAHEEYASNSELVAVPTGNVIRQHLVRIPMRPGSVCLWDSRTPHGNFPNESNQWRLCQYIGLHPAPSPMLQPGLCKTRQDYVRIQAENGRLPKCATETAEARKLIGLELWAPTEAGPDHTMSAMTFKQLGLWDDHPELAPSPPPHPATCQRGVGRSELWASSALAVVATIIGLWLYVA
eukprot:SAG31_NODE_2789_length_5089_cov_4.516433_1_plen_400_part_00